MGSTELNIGFRAAAAVVIPFVVMSAYLLLSRWPSRWFTAPSDYAAGAVSLLAGSIFIATMPISRALPALLLLFYVSMFWFLLFIYSLEFVGVVFGDWI